MNLQLLGAILALTVLAVSGNDLCTQPGCSCLPNSQNEDFKDVSCVCQDKQIFNVGPLVTNGDKAKHNAVSLPSETVSFTLKGCHHVEVFGRSFNHLPQLISVDIGDLQKLILHPRMFESRSVDGSVKTSFVMEAFSIENVRDLKISGHAFEGMHIEKVFNMKNAAVQKLTALAISPDFVGSFNIAKTNFERIPMWGIKLKKCNEANIIDGTHFASLASGAIFLICQRVNIEGNSFGALLDSSFNIQFATIRVNNNLFESILGKPFSSLQVNHDLNSTETSFEFSNNKFTCNPTLPFNSLAFPAFTTMKASSSHTTTINSNHFVCQCGRMDWFLGAIGHHLDTETTSSVEFLQQIYDTAGDCLNCDGIRCVISDRTFSDFVSNINIEKTVNGPLKCSTGKPKPQETTSAPLVQQPEDSKVILAGSGANQLSSFVTVLIMITRMFYLCT